MNVIKRSLPLIGAAALVTGQFALMSKMEDRLALRDEPVSDSVTEFSDGVDRFEKGNYEQASALKLQARLAVFDVLTNFHDRKDVGIAELDEDLATAREMLIASDFKNLNQIETLRLSQIIDNMDYYLSLLEVMGSTKGRNEKSGLIASIINDRLK